MRACRLCGEQHDKNHGYCTACATIYQRLRRRRLRYQPPAPDTGICSRGHLLATVDDVRILADGLRCARCMDDALAEAHAVQHGT